MATKLLTCTCEATQNIDAKGLAQATGLDVPAPCAALCTTQIGLAQKAIEAGDVAIACTQEALVFEELAEALDRPAPPTIDLRDRAGWSDSGDDKLPKMAALLAESLLPARAEKAIDLVSEGLCLIIGPADVALAAAEQLKTHLGVTVLLSDPESDPGPSGFDIIIGQLRQASGAFSAFEVTIDRFQQPDPTGRGARQLSPPRDGARSECDIILDLRGDTPLFSAHEKRDGYLRADPNHPPAVAAAIMAASHLTGTFEKTLYVATDPLICAHSRAEQAGCSRCLDLCPTGAITPDGDHVTVDPLICAGCGACSAACPSGAISYDAPPVDLTFQRVQTLAKAYLDAGGTAPRLMVHNAHGAEMIRLSARHGRGLPADVIPFEISAVGAFGHAECVAALAAGFAQVTILLGPQTDRAALNAQIDLANAIAGPDKTALLDTSDPDQMSDMLYDQRAPAPVAAPVRPLGTRRQITRQAARALHPQADTLALPEGAPYGAVAVDTDACTLCLSCVSLCPAGALGDNEDKPQLRFQEDACLQCGICATICPEQAITLEPRLELTETALEQRILNEEEPFACVECGALFGSKSAIDRITEKLSGYAMFGGDKLRTIQMCDNCRVNAQFHADDNPFASAPRPRVRTTDDYLSKRKDH